MTFPPVLADRLHELHRRHLDRQLQPRRGHDLCSNDYLGFADDPVLRAAFLDAVSNAPVGATGARLVHGDTPIHVAVETRLAAWSQQPAARLFASGYMANVGVLSAVLRPGDDVFSDALNHASLIDGMRLSGATRHVYPHLDVAALEDALQASAAPFKLIVTESLFSMDGDHAPLAAICDLARRHHASVVVDEAHATGLYGCGRVATLGLPVLACVHTGGKALGAAGAWVAASTECIEYLTSTCRTFMFTTAPLPALALVLRCAVDHWDQVGPDRAAAVLARAGEFQRRLGMTPRPGPIVPLVVGTVDRALALEQALQAQGYDVRAIRPPTVPEGQARLRLTVTWPVAPDVLWQAAREIERCGVLA